MKQIIWTILLLVSSTYTSNSQILTGKITNQSAEPVPNATVYITEIRQGTAANAKGEYELRLPPGKYTVTYQSLGYEAVSASVTMETKKVIKDVTLILQYYSIPEVRISASGEDPAYGIMRKVISMAPYYLNNINYYKAEVYLKGNFLINKIPRLLRKSISIGASNENGTSVTNTKLKEGDAFMMESVNEIEFTAPDKYIQKVISINSTIPSEGNQISPMDFIEASFYQPVIGDMFISPLSPAAFSHYNFQYQGASMQGSDLVNKIKVTPKRKSQQLFEGVIYIIDDLWCLQSVNLSIETFAGKIGIQQLYVPVENGIWMPVSHRFEISVSLMGLKADAGYSSSVKYIEVKPNTRLALPKILSSAQSRRKVTADTLAPPKSTKSKKQIESLLSRNDLSNRDMVKLSRLMDKESKNSLSDSVKKDLEIKDKVSRIIEKDAAHKDSTYWTAIRPIPLSSQEKRAVRLNDSTKSVNQLKKSTLSSASDSAGSKKSSKTISRLLKGFTWSDSTRTSFTTSGLADLKSFSFNSVDGFIYGMNFRYYRPWKSGKSFSVFPDFRWAFNRGKPMAKININYQINGLKQTQLYLRAGSTSRDIGNGGSINTFLNSVTSLFLKKNYLKLYESDYLNFGFRTEIANGLMIDISPGFEYRRTLQNNTSFSIFRSDSAYSPNYPENKYLSQPEERDLLLRNQRHGELTARLTFVPFRKYRISGNNKIAAGSDWPEFIFSWQHGVNEFPEYTQKLKQYDRLKFEASQTINSGAFSEFRWRIRSGGFLDNRNLSFYDFFHFNSQPFPVLLNDYEDSFMIPGYYSLSTSEFFGELHLQYKSPYLLLKYLPFLSNSLMRENISLSWLGTRYQKSYAEIGYSLSEIFLIGEAGIYAGFDDLKYRSLGLKLVLKIN